MCGIAGYYGYKYLGDSNVAECRSLMKQRGPDANGIYRYKSDNGLNVILLHSRLSIIDLDPRSNQPFVIGKKVISYNGEIYNYKELKIDASRYSNIRTESDTEVLLSLLSGEGISALDKCEGMWAFAQFCEQSEELIISRDRFGEKPLYYLKTADGIYFGSEIKFIFSLMDKKSGINYDQIHKHLVLGYRYLNGRGDTFYLDVKEFPAGHVAQFSKDLKSKLIKYWNPTFDRFKDMGLEGSIEALKSTLKKSLAMRMRADVPIAFCMSGGVDSNGLIGLANQNSNAEIHAFTILNTHKRYEEQDMVNAALCGHNIKHKSVTLDKKDFVSNVEKLIAYHDAPIYTVSSYAHWVLMQNIAESGYKIVISGIGADELFSGYYDHHLYYLADMYKDDKKSYFEALNNWKTHVLPSIQNPLLKDPNLFVDSPHSLSHLSPNAEFFRSCLVNAWDYSERLKEIKLSKSSLRNRMLNELFFETVPAPLHEEDLNAMYFSLENRSPYLDRNLFELSNSLPTKYLIKNGMAKFLLREALRGLVPEAILQNRKKMGFNAPLLDLLDTNNSKIKEYFLDSGSAIFDVIKRSCIERMLRESNLDHYSNLFLFSVLTTKIFLDQNS